MSANETTEIFSHNVWIHMRAYAVTGESTFGLYKLE
jgi:hypothetical protein